MKAIHAIRHFLTSDASLIAEVPTDRIKAGTLPLGIGLPAIGIAEISSNDRNVPSPGLTRRVTARIQVTVMAINYKTQKDLINLVRKACSDKIEETIGDATQVVVLTSGKGPDLTIPNTEIHMQSQDFMVSYNELT